MSQIVHSLKNNHNTYGIEVDDSGWFIKISRTRLLSLAITHDDIDAIAFVFSIDSILDEIYA